MTPGAGLADAVARTGWDDLLPAHRAEGDRPSGTPTCLASLALAPGVVLAVLRTAEGHLHPAPLIVDGASVRRARAGDGAAEALLALLARGSNRRDGFELTSWHHRPATGERAVDVDQTNESLIVGEAAVVKWAYLADEGPHPAPSLLEVLDRHGFTGMPLPWGAVQWRPPGSDQTRLLALVTGFVPGAVDGWTWVVDDLREAASSTDLEAAHACGAAVGSLVASFHRALAATARPATAAESDSWRAGALADLDRALELTTGRAHQVLRDHETRAREVLATTVQPGDPLIRVHGDLHIGQVLRSHAHGVAAYSLTDFDGNPVVPPAERVREQPAALDVAGMAQSFVHAGLVVHRHHPALEPALVEEVAALARLGFLDAYVAGLGDARPLYDETLLPAFAVRQVCREFIYAATHLPRWSYVPEAALPLLLRGDRP